MRHSCEPRPTPVGASSAGEPWTAFWWKVPTERCEICFRRQDLFCLPFVGNTEVSGLEGEG